MNVKCLEDNSIIVKYPKNCCGWYLVQVIFMNNINKEIKQKPSDRLTLHTVSSSSLSDFIVLICVGT